MTMCMFEGPYHHWGKGKTRAHLETGIHDGIIKDLLSQPVALDISDISVSASGAGEFGGSKDSERPKVMRYKGQRYIHQKLYKIMQHQFTILTFSGSQAMRRRGPPGKPRGGHGGAPALHNLSWGSVV